MRQSSFDSLRPLRSASLDLFHPVSMPQRCAVPKVDQLIEAQVRWCSGKNEAGAVMRLEISQRQS